MNRAEYTVALLAEMAHTIKQCLVAEKINTDRAEQIAYDATDNVRQHFGGINVFIPKDKSLDRMARNSEIFRQFTGGNHEELALKFDMSIQHIYRVVERARAAHSRKEYGKQGDMLEENNNV